MTRTALIALAALIPLVASAADDQVQWGQPVNGLRIGVASSGTSISSDQPPKFKVVAENVSAQPISIPNPDTFVPAKNPDSDDYHVLALIPVIKETLSKPPDPGYGDPAYCVSNSDRTVKETPAKPVTLVPGQDVTWNDISLDTLSYFGDRLPPGDKATIFRCNLLPGGEYDIRFHFANTRTHLAGTNLWTGRLDSGVVHLHINAPSAKGIKLEGGFTLPKQHYFLGEPIIATFAVSNHGEAPIRFPSGCDYAGTGRHDRYSFRAIGEDGQIVPDPVIPNGNGGGIGGECSVNPQGTYTEKLLVNQWCAFPKAGAYSVDCKRTLNISLGTPDDRIPIGLEELSRPAVAIETKLPIIIDDDPSALAAYLVTLVQELITREGDLDLGNQIRALAQARVPAAFQEIVKLLDASPYLQGEGVQCLSCYGKEKAAPVLVDHWPRLSPDAQCLALMSLTDWKSSEVEPLIITALHDKNVQTREQAVLLCSRQKYGGATPVLLAMNGDPDPLVRRYLGAALGETGDKRAIPVLIKLLHDSDPDPFIKIWAAQGLGPFKRTDGVPVMIALLRDPKFRSDEGNIMLVLHDVTGEYLSDNHSAWLRWWDGPGHTKYQSPP